MCKKRVSTHLLVPMLRTLPLSTISSSFFHVGYGSAVKAISSSLLPPFLNAMGLQVLLACFKACHTGGLTSERGIDRDILCQAWSKTRRELARHLLEREKCSKALR